MILLHEEREGFTRRKNEGRGEQEQSEWKGTSSQSPSATLSKVKLLDCNPISNILAPTRVVVAFNRLNLYLNQTVSLLYVNFFFKNRWIEMLTILCCSVAISRGCWFNQFANACISGGHFLALLL